MAEETIPNLAASDSTLIEACVQTNLAAMQGYERLSQYFFESVRKNFELAIETNKRLSGVRTLAELADLQGKLSQEFLDTVSQRSKAASDLGTTIVRDATSPVEAHANGSLAATAVRRTPDAKAA